MAAKQLLPEGSVSRVVRAAPVGTRRFSRAAIEELTLGASADLQELASLAAQRAYNSGRRTVLEEDVVFAREVQVRIRREGS